MEPGDYSVWNQGEGREAGSYESRNENVAFWPQLA